MSTAADQPANHPEASHHWQPPALRWRTIIVAVAILLAALLAVLNAWNLWPFAGGVEVTDNAYVRGRSAIIAPQVSGYVAAVLVHDYEQVHAGQVLVRIDDDIYRARVSQAQANLAAQLAALANSDQAHAARSAALQGQVAGIANAHAQLLRAQADMARVNALERQGAISVREADQTRATLAQAEALLRQANANDEIARQDVRTVDVGRGGLKAQVDIAQAQLQLALIDLGHTIIRAPEAGQLGEVGVRLGQYATNGTQFFTLVPSDRWVIANYKEAQTGHMAVGDEARITVDALDGTRFKGRIERLSPAAGSEFSVLKPDNATGNFVKVPQRIGVRIVLDPGQSRAAQLRPGMSVEARVETRSDP
ncbi:MAG TPA: HlyD family secretion protein [Rhizomicrobium sp.]|jgi:multidrug resistance efflux pump